MEEGGRGRSRRIGRSKGEEGGVGGRRGEDGGGGGRTGEEGGEKGRQLMDWWIIELHAIQHAYLNFLADIKSS